MSTDVSMAVDQVRVLVASASWASDVAALGVLLGRPTVVDEAGGWAQFDPPGTRVLVDRRDDATSTGLMVKVRDLGVVRGALAGSGWEVGAIRTGAHEELLEATTPSGLRLTAYRPLPPPEEDGR